MVDQANEIEVVLRLQNLATKELQQFVKRTKGAGKQAERSFDRVAKSAKRARLGIGKMAGAAVAAFVAFRSLQRVVRSGFGFLEAASEVQEATSKFEVLFGKEAPRATEELNKMAAALGRSRGTLVGAAADLQGLLVPLGFAGDEAADMSIAITGLAQDLESFRNVRFEDVLRDIRSGIVGQSEPLLKYGADLREANVQMVALELGVKKAGKELTQQEKVLVRLTIIQRATKAAQGDVIRTADQYANQMRALNESVKTVRVEMGNFLIPVISEAIGELGGAESISNDLRVAFTTAAFATAGFIRAGVALIKTAREIVAQMGGVDKVLEFVGAATALAVQGFENLVATIRFLGEVSVISFQTLRDAALSGIGKVLEIVNEVNAALNALASFANIDLGLGTAFGTDIIAEAKSLGDIMEDFGEKAKGALNTYSEGVALAEANNRGFTRSLDKIRTSVVGLIGKFDLSELIPDTAEISGKLDAALAQPLSRATAGITASGNAAEKATAQWGFFGRAIAATATAAARAQAEFVAMPAFLQGAAIAAKEYGESLSDVNLGHDLAAGLFQTLESGLAGFSRDLVEGEASFKDFAQSTIKAIGAMIIQFLLLRSIRGALGVGAGGELTGGGIFGAVFNEKGGVMQGSMGTPMPINAYANGGVANSPQLAVFGEGRGAEAFVPLPDGKNIPVKMEGGGGGTTVVFEIRAIDTQSGAEFLAKNADTIATNVANSISSGSNRKIVKAVGR